MILYSLIPEREIFFRSNVKILAILYPEGSMEPKTLIPFNHDGKASMKPKTKPTQQIYVPEGKLIPVQNTLFNLIKLFLNVESLG